MELDMDEQQSFLFLNDIKREIQNGRNVTHFLNIKISNQPDSETGNRIRQRIFRIIEGKTITKNINGYPVAITWKTSATTTSAYYYSNNILLSDTAVRRHTRKLLVDVLSQIDEEFDNIFTNGTTGLAFFCTKPLERRSAFEDLGVGDESEED